jgi:hypothetical protein
MLSLWTDGTISTECNKQKNVRKLFCFCCHLESPDEKSRIRYQLYSNRSKDPDPYQTVTDPVGEFIYPDWGDKVNSGIGMLYRPARLHGLAGRYVNPICQS